MENSITEDHFAKISRWLMDFSVAMLTTMDAQNNALRSRPMALPGGAFTGDLYLFTLAATTKVDEIQKDQQVNLAMADPAASRYLSLSGVANLIRDAGILQERWNESLRVWFPDGPGQNGLAVLQVAVHTAEYWDGKNRVTPQMLHLV